MRSLFKLVGVTCRLRGLVRVVHHLAELIRFGCLRLGLFKLAPHFNVINIAVFSLGFFSLSLQTGSLLCLPENLVSCSFFLLRFIKRYLCLLLILRLLFQPRSSRLDFPLETLNYLFVNFAVFSRPG
ncbi:Uncharacterised protein [Arcanobacterium haemolyticum]|nr:Uncharacterised protein [Arcanobacterium haemolyticum]